MLNRRLLGLAIAAGLATLAGCQNVRAVPAPDSLFAGAVRLTNGTVDVVVAPASGRVVRYGFVGGPNALWTDAAGPDMSGWANFGGSKVWPWPQDGWKAAAGREWPPPGDTPGAAAFAVSTIADGVRLTGPPVPGYGRRIVREIRLDRHGTGVTFDERLDPTATGPLPPAAAWTIAQVPADAVLTADGSVATDVPLPPGMPALATTPAGRGVRVVRGAASAKRFFAAATLTAGLGDGRVFTIALAHPPATAAAGQCQVFVEGTTSALESDRTHYAELEFAAVPTAGASSLVVKWTLTKP